MRGYLEKRAEGEQPQQPQLPTSGLLQQAAPAEQTAAGMTNGPEPTAQQPQATPALTPDQLMQVQQKVTQLEQQKVQLDAEITQCKELAGQFATAAKPAAKGPAQPSQGV
jgi:hypothetical protein